MAMGNSYNDSERCVLAGYDNGDVKMFDLRTNTVRWEGNVRNGVCGVQFDRWAKHTWGSARSSHDCASFVGFAGQRVGKGRAGRPVCGSSQCRSPDCLWAAT